MACRGRQKSRHSSMVSLAKILDMLKTSNILIGKQKKEGWINVLFKGKTFCLKAENN
jgi:hypothetical protein